MSRFFSRDKGVVGVRGDAGVSENVEAVPAGGRALWISGEPPVAKLGEDVPEGLGLPEP